MRGETLETLQHMHKYFLLAPIVVLVVYTIIYRIHKKTSRSCPACGRSLLYHRTFRTALERETRFGVTLTCDVEGSCSYKDCPSNGKDQPERSYLKFVPRSYFSRSPLRRWRFREYFKP